MFHLPRPVVFAVVLVLAAALLWVARPVPGRAEPPSDQELEELYGAVQDSARALPAEQRVRQLLAENPVENLLRQLILHSLISRRVPADELVALAESTATFVPSTRRAGWLYFGTVVQALAARGERLDWADSLARIIVRSSSQGPRLPSSLLLARVFDARGLADSTLALLEPLAGGNPDAAELFGRLGRARERLGREDEAMADYVHAAGAWLEPDTTVLASLRALGAKRGVDSTELERRLAEERDISRQRVVFDEPRVDRRAPRWGGRTLEGRRLRDRDFAGRIVVLKFWGTWCPICLETLPDFQTYYTDTLPRDVVLLSVDREYAAGDSTRAAIQALVRERGWTFPVLYDSTGAVADSFGVRSYPTTVVLDRRGRIRFVNRRELGGQYLARQQVKALLEETAARRRADHASRR